MAKFLDKKEQVIDFQLTPYGKHRLSVGQLKPTYYAFFDTGVTYDSEYAGFSEAQNKIHERVKTETQFLEGILLFEEAENTVPESEFLGSKIFEDGPLDISGLAITGDGADVVVDAAIAAASNEVLVQPVRRIPTCRPTSSSKATKPIIVPLIILLYSI